MRMILILLLLLPGCIPETRQHLPYEDDDSDDDSSSDDDTTDEGPSYALSFEGDSYAEGGEIPQAILGEEFTIRVEFNKTGEIGGVLAQGGGWFLANNTPIHPGELQFNYDVYPKVEFLVQDLNELEDGWHTLEVSRDDLGLVALMIDGERVADQYGAPPLYSLEPFSVGYTESFGPVTGLQLDQFMITKDGEPVLLWEFDEGEGDVATDEIYGVELDLTNPIWVEL